MNPIICKAIQKKVLLQFQYQGRLRVVAPYCHGISTRGSEVLRAVQIRGSSSSNGFGFGKLWLVAQMERPMMLVETFIPDDPGYNADDTAMKQIHCKVAL
jgi:hypothetical protein